MTDTEFAADVAFWLARAAEYAAAPNPPTLAVKYLEHVERLQEECATLRRALLAGEDEDE